MGKWLDKLIGIAILGAILLFILSFLDRIIFDDAIFLEGILKGREGLTIVFICIVIILTGIFFEMPALILVVVLPLIAGTVWLTWPVCIWLVCALLLLYLFQELRKRAPKNHRDRFFSIAYREVVEGLRKTLIYTSIGLAILFITQLVLRGFDAFDEELIRNYEVVFINMRYSLSHVLNLMQLFIILLLLAIIQIASPSFGILKKFLHLKTITSYVLIILTVITSFTFFSSARVAKLERDWILERRSLFEDQIDSIENSQRALLATALIHDAASNLSEQEKIDLVYFLAEASSRLYRDEIIRTGAKDIAKRAPNIEQTEKDVFQVVKENTKKKSTKVREWIDWHNKYRSLYDRFVQSIKFQEKPQTPTIRDLHALQQRSGKLKVNLDSAKEATIEILSSSLTEFIPKGLQPEMKIFLDSLISELTRASLAKLWPEKIENLQSAFKWLNKNLSRRVNIRHDLKRLDWNWNLRKPGDHAESKSKVYMKDRVAVINKEISSRIEAEERRKEAMQNEPFIKKLLEAPKNKRFGSSQWEKVRSSPRVRRGR